MKLKGMKEWRDHLPGLLGTKILIIPLIMISSIVGTWGCYFLLDNLSHWFPTAQIVANEPILPVVGPLIVLLCALLMIYSFGLVGKNCSQNTKQRFMNMDSN